MSFCYSRTIRFQDTDAAGVVYFAQGLAICHEAYEQSLADVGIELQTFFRQGEYIFPITHAEIDFWHPMQCGDRVEVILASQPITESGFEVRYQIQQQGVAQELKRELGQSCDDRSGDSVHRNNRCIATAMTRHVCLQTQPRKKAVLPSSMQLWLNQMCSESLSLGGNNEN